MVISDQSITLIEKALGFELYDHQKAYILDEGELQGGRRSGKTVAYCIKLALSDGEPLDLSKPEQFSDGWELGSKQYQYARTFFRNEFMRIRGILGSYGLPVRDIKGRSSVMSTADKDFLDLLLNDKKLKLEYLHEQHRTYMAVYNAKQEMLIKDLDILEKHIGGYDK